MSQDERASQPRPVKDAHRTLGLWSIRRALTLAFGGAAMLLVAAWFFVSWLLGSPPRDRPEPLDTAAQLELLKLVFALVAGIGALVALVTAYRRQRVDEAASELAQRTQAHAERVQAHNEQVAREAQRHAERVARDAAHDAVERRVTDLYGQAVEQLGHDKAPVRLGGLYSLERLAHDHPQHRQTVVDVVCAYLRMPFRPPPPAVPRSELDTTDQSPEPVHHDAHQELHVRLAAQSLLHRHLVAPPAEEPPATYWDGMVIDLSGAHLIDFDFAHCRTAQATFVKALFTGTARFNGARFTGAASFDGAQFNGNAGFDDARFSGDTLFDRARFSGDVRFIGVHFDGGAWFSEVLFSGDARFRSAEFRGAAEFRRAHFTGNARFGKVRFIRRPDFTDATAGHPNDNHIWPDPWYAQAVAPETAQLVRRDRRRP